MTPQVIQAKLKSMKGNIYNFGNKLHTVKSYTIDNTEEKFTLITTSTRFTRTYKQAELFFKEWYESKENIAMDRVKDKLKESTELVEVKDDSATEEEQSNSNALGPSVFLSDSKTDGLANDLINIMRENITKVAKDPNYIKQAQMIDKSVGTILNVKRMQLDMVKAMNAINKNNSNGNQKAIDKGG